MPFMLFLTLSEDQRAADEDALDRESKVVIHDGLRSDTGDTGDWERLPIAHSLQKLRLENTKVFKFNKFPTES